MCELRRKVCLLNIKSGLIKFIWGEAESRICTYSLEVAQKLSYINHMKTTIEITVEITIETTFPYIAERGMHDWCWVSGGQGAAECWRRSFEKT